MDLLTQIQTNLSTLHLQMIQSLEQTSSVTQSNYNIQHKISSETGISPEHTKQYNNDSIVRIGNEIYNTYNTLHKLIDTLPNDDVLNDHSSINNEIDTLNKQIQHEHNELLQIQQQAELYRERISNVLQQVVIEQLNTNQQG